MNANKGTASDKKIRKPRKIMVIKPSKYEAAEAIHTNRTYWENVFKALDSSVSTMTEKGEFNRLSEVLPSDLYEKVCDTLGIPMTTQSVEENKIVSEVKPRKMFKEPLLSFRKTIQVDREMSSDTDVELSPRNYTRDEQNVHLEFFKKPLREKVTWPSRYLQPEKEDEKSLVRKADDLTSNIANEFCEYMKELGGDQQSQLFTPKAIKELFQIEFDTHVARSLRIVPREMPSVEEKIAKVTNNSEKSRYSFLDREVSKDITAERRPDHLKAFGKSLPRWDQWRTPHNNTKILWRSARNVPKDLVTLKTVWEGITNLRSVKEYCRWMINHPEYRRAPYLRSLGMFDSAVLEARLTFEPQRDTFSPITSPSAPLPMDDIRRRLSQLADSS